MKTDNFLIQLNHVSHVKSIIQGAVSSLKSYASELEGTGLLIKSSSVLVCLSPLCKKDAISGI